MNWQHMFTYTFLVGLLAAAVRYSVPIVLAALGETLSERAGILNLGIEGMMVIGALAGFVATHESGSDFLIGFLAAAVAGALLGLIMAVFSVSLRANQNVTGLALLILSNGISIFSFRVLYGMTTVVPRFTPMEHVQIPVLSAIPFLGPILFSHNVVVYAMLALVGLLAVLVFRTPFGLRLEAAGENPHAADSAGVNVVLVRYIVVTAAGALAALGGAYITISELGLWTDTVTGGRGFIALALVNFGAWNPIRVLAGGLLFGLIEAAQTRLQSLGIPVPPQLMISMPYLLTILVLALTSRAGRLAPTALAQPFKRGEM